MLVEELLDLPGEDVEAPHDDDVLLAVGDGEVAVLVHVAHVPGEEPALPDGLLGGLGPVPVAQHQGRAAQDDLPVLARGQILARLQVHDLGHHVREGDADAAHFVQPLVGVGHDGRHRFGEAVALDHAGPGLGLEGVLDGLGQRGRAHVDGLEAGEVVPVDVGHVVEGHEHGGHPQHEAGPVGLDSPQHLPTLEAGQEHDLRPAEDRRVHGGAHAEAVEEGQHGQDAVLLAELAPGPDLVGVGHQGEVGEHDALGHPCGAAAVDEHRHLLRVRLVGAPRLGRLLAQHLREGRHPAAVHASDLQALLQPHGPVLGEGQGLPQAGDQNALQGCGFQEAHRLPQEEGDGDQEAGPGVLELEAQFVLRVEGVQRGDHAPSPQDAVVGHQELGQVGQEQGHPLPRLKAPLLQGPGEAVRVLVDGLIGAFAAEEVGAGSLRGRLRRLGQDPVQGDPGIVQVGRHGWVVVPEPGMLVHGSPEWALGPEGRLGAG